MRINELQIANPGITAEKVQLYYDKNIEFNNVEFHPNNLGWKEYVKLCEPYIEKYNIYLYLSSNGDFKRLSKPDLIQFYKEMRALVRRYVGTEILNELQISNPGITPKKVHDYLYNHIYDTEYRHEYHNLCKPYIIKYNIGYDITWLSDFEELPKPALIKLYNEMRALVQKHS